MFTGERLKLALSIAQAGISVFQLLLCCCELSSQMLRVGVARRACESPLCWSSAIPLDSVHSMVSGEVNAPFELN